MLGRIKERLRQLGLAGLLAALFFWLPSAEAAGIIESVQAQVSTAADVLPAPVKARMETSVGVIAGQLLTGRRIGQVNGQRAEYERIIREVFDKVLVGYGVEKVTLEPDEETVVYVSLRPWAQRIEQVALQVEVEGMPAHIEALARQDLQGLQGLFENSLLGLPVAAADWTNGVLKRSLNEYMEGNLPEFRADFELDASEQAKVKVIVYPRLPVERTVELFMRSDSVPNTFLLGKRWLVQEKADSLIGVPVDFVARHEQELGTIMTDALDAQPDFRALKLHSKIRFTRGQDMSVWCHSETEAYVLRLDGWADVGGSRQGGSRHNLRARLHAGVHTAARDELFAEMDFFPEPVTLRWALGYQHRFGTGTVAGLRYNLTKKRFEAVAEQELAKRLRLRYEYRWWDHRGEAALRYQLHDFLSLEYAVDKDDKWLRFIGHF